MAAATKTCSNSDCPCDNQQPLVTFGWNNKAKGWRRGKCKVCRNADNKQYRANNRQAILARQQQYYETPEGRAQRQQYHQDNRDTINARNRQYSQTPEARALRRANDNARNATDEAKLLNAARELHRLFYRGELGRTRLPRAEALVGCTWQQYRDLLASKFKQGMLHDENYGNRIGKWAPDHVIPKFAFKGEINEANLEIVYWWGNVQPLWFCENASKGNKYTAEGKRDLIVNYNAWVAAGRLPPN
jgi:hypothetical protein